MLTVCLEELTKLSLYEIHLIGGLINLLIQITDNLALFSELLVDILASYLQPLCDFVDLLEVLVLFFNQLFLCSSHLIYYMPEKALSAI